MTMLRKEQIIVGESQWVHAMTKASRGGFLCGYDRARQTDFSHRRQWIVDRLDALMQVFSIDIAAYAIMSNHYHLVLHIDAERAKSWSPTEVQLRWAVIYPKQAKQVPSKQNIDLWRSRLMDLSWFMRNINEFIARKANFEEQCKGNFWQHRFKSQLLLDEASLLTCMAYVDLNPVRASMATMPENSDFTSVQARINHHKAPSLLPFMKNANDLKAASCPGTLAISRNDYLNLVDAVGRIIRDDKGGAIDPVLAPILTRLDLDSAAWVDNVTHFGRRFHLVIGHYSKLIYWAEHMKKRCVQGHRASKNLFIKYDQERPCIDY